MNTTQTLFELLRRFAAAMASTYEVADVLYELCGSTVALVDAAGAGVSVVGADGQLAFVSASSHLVVAVEETQLLTQTGPCVEAFRRGEVVAVDDISQLDTWPEYRASAARSGLRSVIGVPLVLDRHRLGSLNVYDTKVRSWTETDVNATRVVADIATAYLIRVGELVEFRELSNQLQRALGSRVVIEQAKGFLSQEHSISVDDAFELLRAHARDHNVGIRRVARDVVDRTIDLPCPHGG